MAFHLACPITCLKICYCPLGFSGAVRSREGRRSFLEDVRRLDSLFRNPGLVAAGGRETAEVYVPRVSRVLDPKNGSSAAGEDGNSDRVEEREEQFSSHGKLSSLRKKAALASLVAEEYARKLEQGDIFVPHAPSEALMQQGKIKGNHPSLEETGKLNLQQEDKYSSLPMHVCRLCFSGEEEGTKRAGRMLTCQSCKRKYHRNCLKCWAKNRDLFNWASWVCPSCVTCESCRRVGDPNKLMFCKRCDTAYHCYCQQPPHKNVPSGPFLCPRHTWCHSCGSTVPGSGVSTRWFVGYTFCDACGRLFTKGKYCPICLKVYRDSESTPMVCCDVCQCWVHCQCDGISDEKYQQFQTDRNLYYKCGACRGECYKVKDQDDAVREIWRKRDEFEKDDMAKLREAAGLPSEDEMLRFCPSSDEDDSFPAEARDDMKKKFKAMIKGITEKGARHGKELKAKDSGKKVSKSGLVMKKQVKQNDSQIQPNEMSGTQQTSLTGLQSEVKVGDLEIQDRNSIGNENIEASSLVSDGYKVPFNPKISDSEKADEADNMESKNAVYIQSTSGEKLGKGYKNIRNSKPVHGQIQKALELQTENATGKPESSKSKKLVLHISSKNRNQDTGNAHQKVMLESSNSHREECSASSPGITSNHFSKRDHSSNHEDMRNIGNDAKRLHQDSVTSFRTGKKRATNGYGTAGIQQGSDAHFQNNASPANIRFQKNRGADFDSMHVTKGHDGGPTSTAKKKFKVIHSGRQSDDNENKGIGNANTSSKTAPLILKFKKPSFENTPFFQRLDEDEGNVTKGARSKRRRPSTTDMEGQGKDYADNVLNQDDRSKISDFNWILMHLGRDAVGKKVEVNKPSDGSWHKGSVTGIREHSSDLIVQFDTGREETIELSKQRVRFVSQDKSQNKKT